MTENKESQKTVFPKHWVISEPRQILALSALRQLDVANEDIAKIIGELMACADTSIEDRNETEHVKFMEKFLKFFVDNLALSEEEFIKKFGQDM